MNQTPNIHWIVFHNRDTVVMDYRSKWKCTDSLRTKLEIQVKYRDTIVNQADRLPAHTFKYEVTDEPCGAQS